MKKKPKPKPRAKLFTVNKYTSVSYSLTAGTSDLFLISNK